MRERSSGWMRGALALTILSALLISTLITPAIGHVSDSVDHLWTDHLVAKADNRYYTKALANDRFARKAMWAHVRQDGVIIASSGVASVTRTEGGTYFVSFTASVVDQPVVATVSSFSGDTSGELSVTPCGGPPQGVACPTNVNSSSTVRVLITGGFGALTDMAFFIRVR